MATNSHQLAIAKASLAAGLLRAAPAPISREDIIEFHSLLDQTLTICSPENIQNCKRWILKNMHSMARITSFAKYASAVSPLLSDSESPRGRSSARSKRLHLLYLINDILHHRKYHEPDDSAFAEGIKDILGGLFTVAVYPKAVKQLSKLERLLSIWETKKYYPSSFLGDLKTIVQNIAAANTISEDLTDLPGQGKQKALLLPPFHGDPSIPFYDLPAGNFLPHIIPNSMVPINPRIVKPVQFSSITPSGTLATAVQDFLAAVDTTFSGKGIAEEPDAVGGFGGIEGEGYYGWSKTFCEQMKQKKKAAVEKERLGREKDTDRRGRRYSYSNDSYSPASRSRTRSNSRRGRRQRSRSSSYERSRSRDDGNPQVRSRSRSPSLSRSTSRPNSSFQQFQSSIQNPSTLVPPLPSSMSGGQQFPSHPPPPPPPPPPMSYGFQQQQFPSNWPPPPPPPNAPGFPPPQLVQGFQQFGQFPMGGPMGFNPMGGQWQQQQQQQKGNYNQGNYVYGAGSQGGGGSPSNNEEDYRSTKGRQMGGKRGWKS